MDTPTETVPVKKRGPGRPRKTVAPIIDEPTAIQPDPEEPDIQDEDEQVSTRDLAKAVHALAKGQEALTNSQIRKVPFANHKPRSSFNPTGKKRRKLKRRCYQNGFPMNVVNLHDEEIAALDVLLPGTYLNGIVTVRVDSRGEESTLNIMYKNKSADDKLALKNEFRNLKEFLTRAVAEGPMQD